MADPEQDMLKNVKYDRPESSFPLELTAYLALAILGATAVTFAFQSTLIGMSLWLLFTAPFNIAAEGNVVGNFIVVLVFFAFTEIYLRSTGRPGLAFDIFVASILSTYAVSFYLFLTTQIVGAGTSIVGFSVLAMLILVLLIDLLTWAKRNALENRKLYNLVWVGLVVAAAYVTLEYLVQGLIFSYINQNQSAIFHVMGGVVALVFAFAVAWLRGDRIAISRKLMAGSRA